MVAGVAFQAGGRVLLYAFEGLGDSALTYQGLKNLASKSSTDQAVVTEEGGVPTLVWVGLGVVMVAGAAYYFFRIKGRQ